MVEILEPHKKTCMPPQSGQVQISQTNQGSVGLCKRQGQIRRSDTEELKYFSWCMFAQITHLKYKHKKKAHR